MNLTLILSAVAAAGGAAASGYVVSLYYRAQIADQQQEYRERLVSANKAANRASSELEVMRQRLAEKAAAATRKIEHAVSENRDWAERPLPASVRDALAAARAAAGASEPDHSLP